MQNWDPADDLCDSVSKHLYDDTQGVYLTTLGANNYLGSNNPTAITGPDNGPAGCTNHNYLYFFRKHADGPDL